MISFSKGQNHSVCMKHKESGRNVYGWILIRGILHKYQASYTPIFGLRLNFLHFLSVEPEKFLSHSLCSNMSLNYLGKTEIFTILLELL